MAEPDKTHEGPADWPAAEELEIDAKTLADLMGQKAEFRLIDCREEDEWEITRIEGAELLPLSEFGTKYAAFLPDPGEKLVVQCHHGMRSAKAALFLRQKGYPHVWSLAGGIEAWSTEIDPSVPRY